jgi:CDP-diacylglycerol--glycerol-3-phosphate 3-phosphatidyltransferase
MECTHAGRAIVAARKVVENSCSKGLFPDGHAGKIVGLNYEFVDIVMHWNLPNSLTAFRIAVIPVLVIMYLFADWPGREIWMTSIFAIAAITDWLDGYLARKMNLSSPFGAFLDPVADKLIVSTALVLLVSDMAVLDRAFSSVLFIISVAVIIGREIVISALREVMADMGKRGEVAVDKSGKYKTAFQLISISMLLYAQPLLGLPMFYIGEGLLYLAVGLTLWSMWVYLSAAAKSFEAHNSELDTD